jgi:hypothetical protein
VREKLMAAFAAGFVITGFRSARGDELPAHVLRQTPDPAAGF